MNRLLPLALSALSVAACSDEPADPADNRDTADVSTEAGVPGDVEGDGAADVEADPEVGITDLGDVADAEASDVTSDPDAAADVDSPRQLDPWPVATEPPTCGIATDWPGLIAGPGDEGFDPALDAKTRRLDRQFRAFNAFGTGVNADLSVGLENEEAREQIRTFIWESDLWDFEEYSGESPTTVIDSWHKVAGAYAGVSMAADAYRYLTLLNEGGDCDELERAREFIRSDLDALHLAQAITGVEGVVARGFARLTEPGSNYETTPLFDEDGSPLPAEKTNGTWRADNSGEYPEYIWEDSCSRDMLIGWVLGLGALWEAIRDDESFDDSLRERARGDALALARSLMTVQDSGYDLEVRDADGRMTYHGIMHPESVDRVYVPGVRNGFNAVMSLGIVATLAYVTEDPEVETYLYEDLIDQRGFLRLINDDMVGLDLGHGSNHSGYNMAFEGGWLSMRYLRDSDARAEAARSVRDAMYDRGGDRQPVEMKQTFFDLAYTVAVTGESVFGAPTGAVDEDALTRGMETLQEWDDAPYYDRPAENCDEVEIEARDCAAIDGSQIDVLGNVGRNGDLVARDPIPMRIRGSSNYWWRSNPYKIDQGGQGGSLLPGSDYRWMYWSARWLQRPSE